MCTMRLCMLGPQIGRTFKCTTCLQGLDDAKPIIQANPSSLSTREFEPLAAAIRVTVPPKRGKSGAHGHGNGSFLSVGSGDSNNSSLISGHPLTSLARTGSKLFGSLLADIAPLVNHPSHLASVPGSMCEGMMVLQYVAKHLLWVGTPGVRRFLEQCMSAGMNMQPRLRSKEVSLPAPSSAAQHSLGKNTTWHPSEEGDLQISRFVRLLTQCSRNCILVEEHALDSVGRTHTDIWTPRCCNRPAAGNKSPWGSFAENLARRVRGVTSSPRPSMGPTSSQRQVIIDLQRRSSLQPQAQLDGHHQVFTQRTLLFPMLQLNTPACMGQCGKG